MTENLIDINRMNNKIKFPVTITEPARCICLYLPVVGDASSDTGAPNKTETRERKRKVIINASAFMFPDLDPVSQGFF